MFLLVCAVLYYRAPSSSPVAAPSPAARSSDPVRTPDAEPLPSTPTPEPTGGSGSSSAEVPAIEIYGDHAAKAMPFETVRIHGTYHGGPERFLRVEVREGARWVAYPVGPKTDHLGRFITHVELSQSGPHWVRVLDPKTQVTSEPFVLVIVG